MHARALVRRMATVVAVVVTTAMISAPAGADPVSHRQLIWGPCPDLDPQLRCAAVTVPLDYRHPAGRTITVTISRLPATDPAHRRGVLLTTGGGPGGPGVPAPLQLRQLLDPRVSAEYDLIGFDIRFLERSTPIGCGQPGEEPGAYWVRGAGTQPWATTVAQARGYAAGCARTAGWALPYATTANAARDMDVIRQALGEAKISYLAGSYAGLLGAVYGTLFPARVDRFVLDSPPDADTVWQPFTLGRIPAEESNYRAYSAWLAANDATYHLGATAQATDSWLLALLARANAAPIPAGGQEWTYGELGSMLSDAVFFQSLWVPVTLDLTAIAAGAAPPVPLDVLPTAPPGLGIPADNHTAVNTAYRCGDARWLHDLGADRRILAWYSARYPTYGPVEANVNPCAFWPVSQDALPPLSADRSPGVLVLAALRDAAVPVANSAATRAAIAGSRLVTVDAQAHVPFFSAAADDCMTGAVTRYLLDGVLPATDLAC